MGKEQWKIFRLVCKQCGSTVTTRHQYDWARCKCCAIFVLGNYDPAVGGDPSQALTEDGEPFFGVCNDTHCKRVTWPGYRTCKKHNSYKEPDEFYIE